MYIFRYISRIYMRWSSVLFDTTFVFRIDILLSVPIYQTSDDCTVFNIFPTFWVFVSPDLGSSYYSWITLCITTLSYRPCFTDVEPCFKSDKTGRGSLSMTSVTGVRQQFVCVCPIYVVYKSFCYYFVRCSLRLFYSAHNTQSVSKVLIISAIVNNARHILCCWIQ